MDTLSFTISHKLRLNLDRAYKKAKKATPRLSRSAFICEAIRKMLEAQE